MLQWTIIKNNISFFLQAVLLYDTLRKLISKSAYCPDQIQSVLLSSSSCTDMLWTTSLLKSDPVYTVSDPQGHDTKVNTFRTSLALKFILIFHHLTTANHRKSGESKYDRELAKLDVVTTRIRYRVNGVSGNNLLKRFAASLWMSSFDNHLASSL